MDFWRLFMILEQIDKDLLKMAEESDVILKDIYKKIDDVCLYNSDRILAAFIENHVSYSDFADINGYGNYDEGRDKIERIFATVLGCEDALVRPQIMSGTNALYLTLSALLKHGDTMISISGAPYDSLQEMIGLCGDSTQSLKANGVKYEQIDLVNDDFDDDKIIERLKENNVKLVEIQRSRGYAHRLSLTISKLERIIKKIREVNKDVIIMAAFSDSGRRWRQMIKTFENCSPEYQITIVWFFIFLTLLCMILVIYEGTGKRQRKMLLPDSVLLIVIFLITAVLCVWQRAFYEEDSMILFKIPYVILIVIGIGVFLYVGLKIFGIYKYRKSCLRENAVQESLDNLPSGIVFFDGNGMPKLMNRKMYQICQNLAGRDIQNITELEEALALKN